MDVTPSVTIAASTSEARAGDGSAVVADAGAAREIRGEHRPRERDVGDRAAERVGDDGSFDAARERYAGTGVVAQLEPTRVADRGGEALAARRVVEVGHGRGSELPCQPAGRTPELRLLGRVPGVHSR